ncbi:sensor histidine kinase [Paenibacillus nanensis]|uniref:histidine kinase n=1 Tax=Paenibacillus nanensis TaxID=393251 RepID=A0A3A1UWL7_9BACL|nr:histidine kinase [Paenibacillus nanensis]RIX51582.1 sensor histidine kinase [Paenibacillus nanensis]
MPEGWMIGFKSAVLLYVILSTYETDRGGWYIVMLLLYISLELLGYLVKGSHYKRLAAVLTVAFVCAAAYWMHPALILLAPMAVHSLADSIVRQRVFIFVLMLLPIFIVPDSIVFLYGLLACIAFLYNEMASAHMRRTDFLKKTVEELRADNQRLRKSVSEHGEYIRQSEYTFKLEERNRLSQEIHDKIGHSMTGALIQMEAAKRLQATDAEKSAELLQNAIQISKDGIESIRLVLKNMKPLIEQLGLNRMKLFVDEFSATHNLPTTLSFEGDMDRIEALHWRVIQQNVTEALTNTVKYARATAASVHIEVLNTLIKVNVSDNGAGAAKVVKGLGIAGMEERAAALGGKVIVDGSAGFSVTTLLPYVKT